MRKSVLVLFAVSALIPALSFAHGNTKPQHGGIVQVSGETVFELVVKPSSIELYVSDDDVPVTPAEATASLVVSAGGKTADVPLRAGANNGFVAETALPKGASVGVVVKDVGGAKMFTTFTPK